MRTVKLLLPAFTLAALASLPLAAQQPGQPTPDTPPPNPTQPDQQAPPTQQPPSERPGAVAPTAPTAPSTTAADLRPVSGELVSKLDSKNAKNGDPVVVKTTEKATIGNGVVIPKGSKITGHITDVQAHDSTNPNSKVAIEFDQAEIKGGQTVPIKSVLQGLEPPSGSDGGHGGALGAGAALSAPEPSSGGTAGGGAAAPGSSPSADSQASRQSPTAGTAGSTAQPNPGASSAASGYPAAGTVVARQGNIDIKTTAIPGVLIASASNGQPFLNASGALLGARQNIHLDGGTKVTLAIADANTKASDMR